jgi:t-SNARE complex subunit (syntaxin)
MMQIEEESVDFELIKNREKEMHEINSDLEKISDVYKGLATIVSEQSVTIDSIEDNVEDSAIQVYESTVILEKAKQNKISYRKRMFFFGGILLIMFIVVLSAVMVDI